MKRLPTLLLAITATTFFLLSFAVGESRGLFVVLGLVFVVLAVTLARRTVAV